MQSILTIAGLAMALCGSALLATNAFVSKERAAAGVFGRIAPSRGDSGFELPVVRARLAERRRAQCGFALLALGTALQLVGALPV